MGAVNSVRRQTDGLNLHGRLSAFPISRMHTSSSTDNKRRQFWHKSRPQILPRLRQLGEPVAPSGYIRDSFAHDPPHHPPPHPFAFPFLSIFCPFLSPLLFIDRRINPTWRAKQAESTLTCRRSGGREEISVEFHSRPRPVIPGRPFELDVWMARLIKIRVFRGSLTGLCPMRVFESRAKERQLDSVWSIMHC